MLFMLICYLRYFVLFYLDLQSFLNVIDNLQAI